MENNILSLVTTHRSQSSKVGHIYLVGAGPGDPELIAVKAVRLLQQADAIVYDRLVSPTLLEYAQAGCELIYVGKKKHRHSLPQHQICELLATLAHNGKQVVRLKGGDPFIFGRGGEEVDYLNKQGLQSTVVPGITAATGCAAATQIPLTHRDHAHAVTFITGHRQNGTVHINWDLALQKDCTVVFYMGLCNLEAITHQLIKRGCPENKPFAVVAQGTSDGQQVVLGELSDIAAKVKSFSLTSPALLIMGDAVKANGYAQYLADQPRLKLTASLAEVV